MFIRSVDEFLENFNGGVEGLRKNRPDSFDVKIQFAKSGRRSTLGMVNIRSTDYEVYFSWKKEKNTNGCLVMRRVGQQEFLFLKMQPDKGYAIVGQINLRDMKGMLAEANIGYVSDEDKLTAIQCAFKSCMDKMGVYSDLIVPAQIVDNLTSAGGDIIRESLFPKPPKDKAGKPDMNAELSRVYGTLRSGQPVARVTANTEGDPILTLLIRRYVVEP